MQSFPALPTLVPLRAKQDSVAVFKKTPANVFLQERVLSVQKEYNPGWTGLQNTIPGATTASRLRTSSSRYCLSIQRKGRAPVFRGASSGVSSMAAAEGENVAYHDEKITGAASRTIPDDLEALKAALLDAENRAADAEKAREDALRALSISEAKAEEYAAAIALTTEKAMLELQASKELFKSELDKKLEEKSLELAVAKCEAINLAVNVERITQKSLQSSAQSMTKDALLKVRTADTAAAEAASKTEKSIVRATAEAAAVVMQEASSAMKEAMAAALMAREQATKAQEARAKQLDVFEELAQAKSAAISLEGKLFLLDQKLRVSEGHVQNLQADLAAAQVKTDTALARTAQAEAAVREIQITAEKKAQEQHEMMSQAVESIKGTVASREDTSNSAINADLNALKTAYDAAQEAANIKEQASNRVTEALERSLAAAEGTAKAWKNRALTLEEFMIQSKKEDPRPLPSATTEEIIAGGRMETLLGNDARKWDLLANGPRRETPDWMKWRIQIGLQGLPPRTPLPVTARVEALLPLYLPTPEEVWSISSATSKDDLFTKQAVEKEALDEQRRALERALQKRTLKRHPEEGEGKLESGTGSGQEVVFQGFNWESWRRKWYLELIPKASDLAKCGITTVWLPPPTESVSPQGYMPGDLYNLNSAYGSVEELKQCIDEMHNNDILVLGDAVLNHRCAQKQSANGIWNIFGGKLAWGPEAIVKDDPNFHGRGNPSSGDFFHAAPNIDHSQDFVQKDIKGWMKWLRTEIGFDGWRLDFVRGFWGGYVKEYIEATTPVFSIGEYWDSLAYEGGQVCYNQDAHRQRIINWINATGGSSSAFDVTTKGILHSALHNEFWRLIDPQGKPPGVMGWWPSRAVTFLENHDTGSTQGHWPFPRDKLMQGYAYILTHPGTPVIFYDHFYDFGLHDQVAELIAARKRTGVHCRSQVKIFHANFDGYVAQVGDNLIMKMGRLDWNPSKENNLVGSWERFLDRGADFQLWERRGQRLV